MLKLEASSRALSVRICWEGTVCFSLSRTIEDRLVARSIGACYFTLPKEIYKVAHEPPNGTILAKLRDCSRLNKGRLGSAIGLCPSTSQANLDPKTRIDNNFAKAKQQYSCRTLCILRFSLNDDFLEEKGISDPIIHYYVSQLGCVILYTTRDFG